MFLLMDLLQSVCTVKRSEGRPSGAGMFGLLAAHPRLRPDLILLDIQIPHENGYMILDEIRKRPYLRETLVVAVTANVMPQDVERCRKAGFDGFLGKPLKPKVFPDQLRRILSGEAVWEPR
jgi:two-component system cell cycle response regulator DivK